MQKTGLVMSINKNHVCVMTPSGDFLRLKINKGSTPMKGQEYTGSVANKTILRSNIFEKYKTLAASFILFFFIGFGMYSYYTPVTAATININPSIKLSCNKFNRVIYTNALNEDGSKILSEISIKNLSLDEALIKIVDQSIKDSFINSKYINEKCIFLNITGKEASIVNFEKKLEQNKINIEIKTNDNIKKINQNNNGNSNSNSNNNNNNSNGNGKSNNINLKGDQNKSINNQKTDKLDSTEKSNSTNSTSLNIEKYQIPNTEKKENSNINVDKNIGKNISLEKRK